MKTRLNLICILLLFAFSGYCYMGIKAGLDGGNDSVHRNSKKLPKLTYVDLIPENKDIMTDSIFDSSNDTYISYQLSTIRTEERTTDGLGLAQLLIIFLLGMPVMIMSVISIFLFCKLILSIRKKDIFCNKNIFRVRFISLNILIFCLTKICTQFIGYYMAKNTMQVPGYQIEMPNINWGLLVAALLLAVFAEIFAEAIKLKEEQDLTI